jgi:hypothetical protein
VYDALFQKLAEQEAQARERRGKAGKAGGSTAGPTYPRFGTSVASWPEVSAFYSEWGGFVTAKDFSWADEYNLAAAPNRKVCGGSECLYEEEKVGRGMGGGGARATLTHTVRGIYAKAARQAEC